MPFQKARKRAAKNRDFTNKEVYLLLLNEMNKKLDEAEERVKDMNDKFIPQLLKQAEILSEVCKNLPEKGFCGRVDKMYDDMYPANEESIPKKIGILWYDRKLMKWLLGTRLAALITGLITLSLGFLKGVF